ncbi:MAG: response regulator transcription factor, partial [Verrucomicrobiota bacterium]
MHKKIRIMVVDDHFVVRIGVAESISLETDMSVDIEASNGQQAIARFRDEKPDIVLMDVKLPDMSGIEALKRIRQVSLIPVLMLT